MLGLIVLFLREINKTYEKNQQFSSWNYAVSCRSFCTANGLF